MIIMKYQSIFNRLRRIEGQIRGIEEMLNKEKPEAEILIQLQAAKSSLASTVTAMVSAIIDKKGEKVELSESDLRLILNLLR